MDKKLVEVLQQQVNAELYSAYLYFSMSSWCDTNNLKGFANWLRVQAQEEQSHATYLHDYILRRGDISPMKALDAPPNVWKDIAELCAQVLEHEKKVTAMIANIADIALECKDHATYQFIMLYVNEQVEEEENASDLVHKVTIAKDTPPLLYSLDAELATRVFTPSFGASAK